MNIGYTTQKESPKELQDKCQRVEYAYKTKQTSEGIINFLNDNLDNQIYVNQISDLGLQLVQLLPCLNFLFTHNKIIHFIDKGPLKGQSDLEYCRSLLYLARNDQQIMMKRTVSGLAKSREKGIKSGRPALSDKKVEKIQDLYQKELRTLREIARICNVSLGTVHKYTRDCHRNVNY